MINRLYILFPQERGNLIRDCVETKLEEADTPLVNANAPFKALFPSGYALRQQSKRSTFTQEQLLFVEEKFNQGSPSTAKKAQPEVVAQLMHEATFEDNDGNTRARFSPKFWLSEDQIRNLFSKMASLDIRVGELQDAQNNSEAAQATDEELGNMFVANIESNAINEASIQRHDYITILISFNLPIKIHTKKMLQMPLFYHLHYNRKQKKRKLTNFKNEKKNFLSKPYFIPPNKRKEEILNPL